MACVGGGTKGGAAVALIPAAELAGLMETAQLLRSPKDARRLMTALRRAERGTTQTATAVLFRRELLGEKNT